MAKQNKIITRIGKGTKLTSSEMDGNLEHLQRLGIGENIGVIEPTDVDLSEIKNQFISKGDVSVSLGDTEITHEVTGFSRALDQNFIQITDESSDIQEGDTITITGDSEEQLNYTVYRFDELSFLINGQVNLNPGDNITITDEAKNISKSIDASYGGVRFGKNLIGESITSFNLPLNQKSGEVAPKPGDIITITDSIDLTINTNVRVVGDPVYVGENLIDDVIYDEFLINLKPSVSGTIGERFISGLQFNLSGTLSGKYDGIKTVDKHDGSTEVFSFKLLVVRDGEKVVAPTVVDENSVLSIAMTIPSNNGQYEIDSVFFDSKTYWTNIAIKGTLRNYVTSGISNIYGTANYTLDNSGTYVILGTKDNGLGYTDVILTSQLYRKDEFNTNATMSFTVGSNNGTYTVLGYNSLQGIQVEEPVVGKETTGVTGSWIKSTRVEFSWIHAVLECGVVIWEAYDNNSNEEITGYWLAMKQNGEGEWVMVDFVKMTESFWNNWYEYTVKDPSNPRSVKLVGYDSENGGGNPWNLQSASPKFYHCELSMNESLTELTVTETRISATDLTYWDAIATELGVSTEGLGNGGIATPMWDSNDDWYGMMWGERMGWIWIPITDPNGDSLGIVGFNMLSGETQKYTSSQLNPFGESYENSANWGDSMSHSKFGLLVRLIANNNHYLYSPNFVEQKATKISQPIDYNTIYEPMIPSPGRAWDFSGKFMYVSTYKSHPSETNYTIMRIDIESGNVEYGIIKDNDYRLDPLVKYFYSQGEYSSYNLENANQSYWTRSNGWISSIVRWGEPNNRPRNYVVWKDNESKPMLVKGYGYPTNFTSNTAFSADYMWKLQAIVSSTSTYKNNTF